MLHLPTCMLHASAHSRYGNSHTSSVAALTYPHTALRSSRSCVAFDSAALETFRAGMARCFTAAVQAGLGVSVVPHLDDGAGRWPGNWDWSWLAGLN